MALDSQSEELLRQTTGMQPMQTATGLLAFYRSLTCPYDQLLVAEGDLPKITSYLQRTGLFNAGSSAEDGAPYQYANKAEEFYSEATWRTSSEFKEEYLTFAPFDQKKPGFSVSRVFLQPEKYPDELNEALSKQIEMRQVLFCDEDFARLTSVLDFGCGHGTDVIHCRLAIFRKPGRRLELDATLVGVDRRRGAQVLEEKCDESRIRRSIEQRALARALPHRCQCLGMCDRHGAIAAAPGPRAAGPRR